MFESISTLFGGTDTDEEKISPADVAEDVSTAHEKMDELKEWSAQTNQWLDDEMERLKTIDEPGLIEEISDLQLYVNTIALRLEYGDASLRVEGDPEELKEVREA